MLLRKVPLTLGIEEEYQIVHTETRDLHSYVQHMLDQANQVFPESELIKPEFLQSQVEVGSHVCRNVKEVRHELVRLRGIVNQLTGDETKIVAASTHPFASWVDQNVTAGERYLKLLDDMRGVAERLLIFGMHVHVGFGEWEGSQNLMIEVMNQLRYFLPHILAFSTSSPFWHGRDTGLHSYRSVVFEMLPRTGIPESFNSWGEYQEFIGLMGEVGAISDKSSASKAGDATKIWWDVRPHPKFGTLEIRVADICTRIDDAVAIVALVQALVAKLIQLRDNNQIWRPYRRHHITENKWRAMRYGINEVHLIDFGRREEVPFSLLTSELLELLEDVSKDLGSWDELQHLKRILQTGTSASRQLRVYRQALNDGASEQDALKAVVDHLAAETLEGVV